jgi:dihydrofolate reductase
MGGRRGGSGTTSRGAAEQTFAITARRKGSSAGETSRNSKEVDVNMSRLTADLFISLDGFAAGEDFGPYFGYSGPDLDTWVADELAKPQVLLMGRRTFEVLAPMARNGTGEGNRRMNDLPKVVVSQTLKDAHLWRNAQIVSGDVEKALAGMKAGGGPPLRSIGSLSLVRSLLKGGLVDRLRLLVFPIVAGARGSEPLFGEAFGDSIALKLASTTTLDGRLVLLEYGPHQAKAGGAELA